MPVMRISGRDEQGQTLDERPMTPEEEQYFEQKAAIQALLDAEAFDAAVLWDACRAMARRLFT